MFEKKMMDEGVEPLPKDTSRWKKPSREEPAKISPNASKLLEIISTAELVNGHRPSDK